MSIMDHIWAALTMMVAIIMIMGLFIIVSAAWLEIKLYYKMLQSDKVVCDGFVCYYLVSSYEDQVCTENGRLINCSSISSSERTLRSVWI